MRLDERARAAAVDWLVLVVAVALPCWQLTALDRDYHFDWSNHQWAISYTAAFFRQHWTMPGAFHTVEITGLAVPVFYGSLFTPVMGVLARITSPELAIRIAVVALYAAPFRLVAKALGRGGARGARPRARARAPDRGGRAVRRAVPAGVEGAGPGGRAALGRARRRGPGDLGDLSADQPVQPRRAPRVVRDRPPGVRARAARAALPRRRCAPAPPPRLRADAGAHARRRHAPDHGAARRADVRRARRGVLVAAARRPRADPRDRPSDRALARARRDLHRAVAVRDARVRRRPRDP